MRSVFIDENLGNPFPTKITLVDKMLGIFPASTDGYYHNDELIKATAKKLASIIGLRKGERTIDVGYGINLSVAEAMQELRMNAYGLDSQDGLDHQRYPNELIVPPHFNAEQKGVRKYCGTIEDILHHESELRDKKFDLFTFWGSWESGGCNFAIGGEMSEFRVRQTRPDIARMIDERGHNKETSEILYSAMQDNRDEILRDCVTVLNPNGGILIVSSRYARHGTGFTTDQLPWEKRIMLRLGQTFSDLGAQEVYLIGVSQDEVQRQLGTNPNFIDVDRVLKDDSALFKMDREFYEAKCSDTMLRAIKDMKVPLGRIDVVYGRF